MYEKLNDENFMLFCAKHYDNSKYASTEEFYEDLSRIKYIKKLITRYIQDNDLKERLILNHIIILNNCFGPEALNKILYLKLKDQMKYVKPFLIMLNILPEKSKQRAKQQYDERIKVGNHPNSFGSCPHCNKYGQLRAMKRWHFDNCSILKSFQQ